MLDRHHPPLSLVQCRAFREERRGMPVLPHAQQNQVETWRVNFLSKEFYN